MNAQMGKNKDERARAEQLLGELDSRETLKMLREETTLLVLMVRVVVQERRESWEAEHAEEEIA